MLFHVTVNRTSLNASPFPFFRRLSHDFLTQYLSFPRQLFTKMSQILHPEGILPSLSLSWTWCQSVFGFVLAFLAFLTRFCVLVHGCWWLVVLWAQRSSETDEEKNIVYLSVNAIDLQNPKVELTASGVTVEGVQKGTEATYKVSLEFYEDINVEVPYPVAPLLQFLFSLDPKLAILHLISVFSFSWRIVLVSLFLVVRSALFALLCLRGFSLLGV